MIKVLKISVKTYSDLKTFHFYKLLALLALLVAVAVEEAIVVAVLVPEADEWL